MVAAGVADEVDIVLYVIGEHRYAIDGLERREIEDDDLIWDYDEFQSNYAQVRDQVLGEGTGRNLLTTFAQPRLLTAGAPFDIVRDEQVLYGSFWDIYGQLAGEGCDAPGTWYPDRRVVDPCYGDASAELPVACVEAGAGEQSSAAFACEELTDLSAALVGMIPDETWVTRLEMRLPREALDMDCEVIPIDPDAVSNAHEAARAVGEPPCDQPLFSASALPSWLPVPFGRVPTPAALIALCVGAALARRWRRSR
jgi:hypothetical protein